MQKKIMFLTLMLFGLMNLSAQDAKKNEDLPKTKLYTLLTEKGTVLKSTDIHLSKLKTAYAMSTTRIKKIMKGRDASYFYQIDQEGRNGMYTGSVEYSDLSDVIKAIASLKINYENDIASNAGYMEGKFVTEDGFQVGYFVSKGKGMWHIKLRQVDEDDALFIEDIDSVEASLIIAKNKMEALMML